MIKGIFGWAKDTTALIMQLLEKQYMGVNIHICFLLLCPV